MNLDSQKRPGLKKEIWESSEYESLSLLSVFRAKLLGAQTQTQSKGDWEGESGELRKKAGPRGRAVVGVAVLSL